MMITIYGASDDLVEVEGCIGADKFGVYGDGKLLWRGDLVSPDEGKLRVHAIYDGCWHFAVGQADEDIPIPPWPVSFTQGGLAPAAPGDEADPYPRYSVVLRIDAPEGTQLRNLWPVPGAWLN
jgi:hypothetical protein